MPDRTPTPGACSQMTLSDTIQAVRLFLAAFLFSIIFSLIPDHNPHVVEHIPHPARRFTSLTSCPHQHDSGIMKVINLWVLFLPVCWGYNGNGAVQGDTICRCTHAGHPIMIFYLVVALSPTLCSSCAASLHSLCTYIRYLSSALFLAPTFIR